MRNAAPYEVLTVPQQEPTHDSRRVITVDPGTDPRYEAFVASHPHALIYHHPAWLEVLARENGNRPVCLACEDADGRFQGVLALFATRGLPLLGGHLTGRRLSSLPRTPVAGPLTRDRDATRALLESVMAYANENSRMQVQIKVAPSETAALDGLVEGIAGAPWRPYYVVELPERIEDLRFGNSRNHARIRSTVNKAEKMNLRTREANTEGDLRAWYNVYLETMRWHAIPPRSYRFFKAMWDILHPRGVFRLLLAEIHDLSRPRLLGGSIFLMFGQTYFYAFNGCRRNDLSLQPNDIIQWRAIHDACREGFRYYDLGEVPEKHDGLSFFKSKWGAQEKWLHRYYYPAPREFESGALGASRTNAFLKAAWRKMPLPVTTAAGEVLYHFL